ncbi:MAG: glycosyltransferase [Pyrinomonadaceae bacterium]
MRLLGSEYDIRLRYQSDVTEEDIDEATLVVVYYWLQFQEMQPLTPAFRRNRHKLLVGICSSYELEDERRDPGLDVIRDLASAVFVNNLILHRQYQPLLKIPTFYTPNGVDTTFFLPATSQAPSSMLRAGWAGSLRNRGPGDYRGYLEFIVPAVAAVESVELISAAREEKWRGPEEMRDFYQSLDVYVCASRADGTPNPCLEAAACGVPLLTTCVGNMPEFVRHGINGFFVERNVDDIARRLRTLRDDSNLRTGMSTQIRDDIQMWDWSLRSRAYRNMFQEMVLKARNEKRVSIAIANAKESIADVADDLNFRVVAVISAYNEEDIIVPCLQHLIKQGLEVYLIDNWSTDSTVELASEFLGKGLLAIEKFPQDRPPSHYLWKDILTRIEQVTTEIRADWFLFQDVDEISASPWPGLSLREAILKVDREGFNCIDHTMATFHPVDNDFTAGSDFEAYFKHFELSDRLGQFLRIKGWKSLGQRVSLATSGGHEIQFAGRRTYPFRFLLKHYPVRSQAHGEKKILGERKPRWLPQERASGWHDHYDHINEGHSFLRRPDVLKLFSESNFSQMSVKDGPPIIDWASEHIRALRSKPDRLLTLVNLELKKKDESVQALAAELQNRKRTRYAAPAIRAARKSELESKRVEFKRATTQLAEKDKHIHELLHQVGERQNAVESLASELTETHKILVALVDQVADPQSSVDALGADVESTQRADGKTTIRSSWHSLAPYEKLKQSLILPFFRLLKRTRRPG